MKQLNALLILFAIFASPNLRAEQYAYLPEARLYLGGGYNPYYPREGFRECIESDGQRTVNTDGAQYANVSVSLVKSREDLYSKLHFSMSLAGSYSFFSAGGSVRMDNEDRFHSDSLTWIVLFEQKFGRFVLNNPRLKKEFRNYSQSELYKACGSEIVTESTKSAMVYSLITVKNLSESHKRDLEAKFSGSMSGGVWSAKMNSHFQSLVQSSLEVSQVQVEIKAIGGRGISDLSDVIGGSKDGTIQSYVNYSNIPNVLSQYLKGISAENAVPTEFTTTHVSRFKPSVKMDYNDFRSGQIELLYSRYLTVKEALQKIDRILYGEDRVAYLMDAKADADLNRYRALYESYLSEISSAGESCFDRTLKKCDLPRATITRIQWPAKNEAYFCDLKRREANQAGILVGGLMDLAEKHNLVPIIEYRNMQPVSAGMKRCGE